MLCHECFKAGKNSEAVGLCHSCSAGLRRSCLCDRSASYCDVPFQDRSLAHRARQFLCSTCPGAFQQVEVMDLQAETSKECCAPVVAQVKEALRELRTTILIDFYSAAARSRQEDLDRIEQDGRRDSPDWHLAGGFLHLAQGLRQAREQEEDLRRCIARSSTRLKNG